METPLSEYFSLLPFCNFGAKPQLQIAQLIILHINFSTKVTFEIL